MLGFEEGQQIQQAAHLTHYVEEDTRPRRAVILALYALKRHTTKCDAKAFSTS